MNKQEILETMKKLFNSKELNYMHIGAGAALCIHGGKEEASDIDVQVDLISILKMISIHYGINITESFINKSPRIAIENVELFYDPKISNQYYNHLKHKFDIIEGVKVDSIDAVVSWYQLAVNKMGRDKDHKNLELALKLKASKTEKPNYEKW